MIRTTRGYAMVTRTRFQGVLQQAPNLPKAEKFYGAVAKRVKSQSVKILHQPNSERHGS